MKSLKYAGIALCSMLTMVSCSEEQIVSNNSQQIEGNYTVEVSRVLESRTWLPEEPVGGEYPTYWSTDDRIEVSSGDRKVRGKLSLYEGGNTENAKFKGLVNGAHSKLEYAVYPLPNSKGEIELTSRSYSNPNAPMIGTFGADKSRVNFENTCGMFRLVINNYPADKNLIVTGNGISGKAKPVKNGDKWDLQWTTDGKNQVTITDTPSEVGKVVFYVPVITDEVYDPNDGLSSINPTSITIKLEGTNAEITKSLKIAKQQVSTSENSSFLELTYHEDTDELTEAWDGETSTGVVVEGGILNIHDAAQLKAFAEEVKGGNNFSGVTIKLINDIDLNKQPWTPIGEYGTGNTYFRGTFDGNGKTISNLKVDAGYAGLFGVLKDATVKDLTIENAGITGTAYAGGIAGSCQSGNTLENVQMVNCTVNGVENSQTLIGGYASNGYAVIDGVYTVIVENPERLAEILTLDKIKIKVILANNIDLPITSLGSITGGSGEYKLGGESTESITIDLNDKKLNITTTYWSNLGAKNDNATFTIKNGTMTSSQPSGTWNSYDLTFSNCDYVIDDVVFDKAIAFGNTGKSVSLENVTINETHDYYAMWIEAVGQKVTIDGLTINSTSGRGIKIDEQYVDTPEKVSLEINDATFKTANKAAILVKSAAGAEITINKINITEVAEDKVCAVWVDEDAASSYDLVTVNGGCKKLEGADFYVDVNGVAHTGTQKGLAEALEYKVDEIHLMPGKYQADIYDITEREVLNIVGTEGTKIAFNNLQVRASQFKQFTVENCEIERMPNKNWGHLVFGSGNKADGVYTVRNCTFNGVGSQGIYINENMSGATYNIENCTFNDDFGGEGAITIQNNDGVEHNVNITGCKFNNIPNTSHKVYVHYEYDGFNLTTDLESKDIYWNK